MSDPDGPKFSRDFQVDEVGETWISLRHKTEHHWWRFDVVDKNGRLQLLHVNHRAAQTARRPILDYAIDAYDAATLEARHRGMVD